MGHLTQPNLSSHTRAEIIKHCINQKQIPINKAGIYKLLKQYCAGNNVRDSWNVAGWSRLLDESDVQKITNDLINTHGSTIGKEVVQKKFKAVNDANVIRSGLVPIIDAGKMRRTSISNYMALLTVQPGLIMFRKTMNKNGLKIYCRKQSHIINRISVYDCCHPFVCRSKNKS